MTSRTRQQLLARSSGQPVDCTGLDREAPLRELSLRVPTLANDVHLVLLSDAPTFPSDMSRYCKRHAELELVAVNRLADGVYRATVCKTSTSTPYARSAGRIATQTRPVTTTIVIDLANVSAETRIVRVGSRIADAKEWATHARVLAVDSSTVAALASWCGSTGHAIVDASVVQDGGMSVLIQMRSQPALDEEQTPAYSSPAYVVRLETDDMTRLHQALQQALAARADHRHAVILFAGGAIQLLRSTVAVVLGSQRLTRLVNRVAATRQSDGDLVLAEELRWASAAGVELLVSAPGLAELQTSCPQLIAGDVLQPATEADWQRITKTP